MTTNSLQNPQITFANYFGEDALSPYLFALSKKMEEGYIYIKVDKLPQTEFWKVYKKDSNTYKV